MWASFNADRKKPVERGRFKIAAGGQLVSSRSGRRLKVRRPRAEERMSLAVW